MSDKVLNTKETDEQTERLVVPYAISRLSSILHDLDEVKDRVLQLKKFIVAHQRNRDGALAKD
jgi:hypothetical protein